MHINNLLLFSHLSHVPLLATPWTTIPLSSTISWSLLKFMSVELVMLSDHLIFCHPFSFCLQSFPTSGSFPVNQIFTSGGQSVGALASASVLPMNIQGWFPLGLTGLISSKLSRVFTSIKIWKHQFFGAQPSLWLNSHNCTWLLITVQVPNWKLRKEKFVWGQAVCQWSQRGRSTWHHI